MKPRRSLRLLDAGYYDSQGRPCISYKETVYKVFGRRTMVSRRQPREDHNDDDALCTWYESNHGTDIRSPTTSRWKILGFLFVILPLIFGLAYWIHPSSSILRSGPAQPESSPTGKLNTECAHVAEQLRELQDRMRFLFPEANMWPNFALRSQGATVLERQTSQSYWAPRAGMTIFGLPLWKTPVNPNVVLEGKWPPVPGRCWAFAGGRGHLFIALSHQVTVSHVSMGHISKNMAPTGTILSAPKLFSVYGLNTLDEEGIRLGAFEYDQDGDCMQTFKLPVSHDHKNVAFKFVRLQVESNWGHPDYTCMYSFRVHGKLA